MQLSIKIIVVLFFFSLILFGFSHQADFALDTEVTTVAPEPKPAVKIGKLPKEVKESSGLEAGPKPGTFLTHNDAGNAPELFQVDKQGNLLAVLTVAGAENIDWEDITRDNQGNIYIGDIGNNSNKRKRLKIYKLLNGDPDQVEVIEFEYADRKAGTADRKHFEFDSEALFWHRSKLYLVTKDREDGVNAKLYQLPDKAGEYDAKLLGNYDINAAITSADVSPDGKNLLLLSNGHIHIFPANGTPNFFSSTKETRPLGKIGQAEAVLFTDNNTILISNEDGNLYQYEL